jgi:L-asparaginase
MKKRKKFSKNQNNGTEIVVISQCISGGISIGKYNNSNIFKKVGAISGEDITAESALRKSNAFDRQSEI